MIGSYVDVMSKRPPILKSRMTTPSQRTVAPPKRSVSVGEIVLYWLDDDSQKYKCTIKDNMIVTFNGFIESFFLKPIFNLRLRLRIQSYWLDKNLLNHFSLADF